MMMYLLKKDDKFYCFETITDLTIFINGNYQSLRYKFSVYDTFELNGLTFYRAEVIKSKTKRKNHNLDVVNHLRTL